MHPTIAKYMRQKIADEQAAIRKQEEIQKEKEKANEKPINDFKNVHPLIAKQLIEEREKKIREKKRKIELKLQKEKEARDVIEAAKQAKILSVHPLLRV